MGIRSASSRHPTLAVLLVVTFSLRASARTTDEDDNELREDVLLCEEALAHVASCCAFTPTTTACHYYHFEERSPCGCEGGTGGWRRRDVRPSVSKDTARDMTAMSCEEMRGGHCAEFIERLMKPDETEDSQESKCGY
jgi:hypothetical protein